MNPSQNHVILSHSIPYYPILSHIIPYYPILSHITPYSLVQALFSTAIPGDGRNTVLAPASVVFSRPTYHDWLVVLKMNLFFPYIENIHPIWLIFFRGVQTTNQVTYHEYTTCFYVLGSQIHCHGQWEKCLVWKTWLWLSMNINKQMHKHQLWATLW